jgi:hypothetical protein
MLTVLFYLSRFASLTKMSARKYMNKAAVIRKDAIIHLFRQVLFRL